MSKLTKILLTISGLLLIFDAYLMAAKKPNQLNPNLPLPCPVTLAFLGAGLISAVCTGKKVKAKC